jgi:hypothetical protein
MQPDKFMTARLGLYVPAGHLIGATISAVGQ